MLNSVQSKYVPQCIIKTTSFKIIKTYYIILLSLLLCSRLFAQPFQIGHTTITFIDTSRNNRDIPTEIYYPADVAGNAVPVTIASTDKFPVLSFGHGFVMTWDAYQNIWNAVVPEGFIIAFPKTEGGLLPSHEEFGKDIVFVIVAISALGKDTSSLFYNRVDSMNCVMGHSMGGGSAFLAAQFNPSIKSLATLAPAETSPSAIQASANLTLPSLIIAGGNDCVTPPPAHQIPMYESLQSNCKTFIGINGGSHCQMAENNLLCSFGEATCSPGPTITRVEQHIVITRYLLPWLKYQLEQDCFSGMQFDSLITSDTSIVFQKTCLLCIPSSASEKPPTYKFEIYPNPFNDRILIHYTSSKRNKINIELFSMTGSIITSQRFSNVRPNERLELTFDDILPPGMYLLQVTMDRQTLVQRMIKH